MIEEQLSSINTEIIMVFAHTSKPDIARNIRSKISAFLDEENLYNPDFVRFREFRIAEATREARSYTRPQKKSVKVMLESSGILPSPYKAVYGSISAGDVVDWHQSYGNKLFAENLRYAIEKSEINDGIISTAQNEPESFWYFNNGITAICDSIEKLPMGGRDTTSGVFEVKKISIINGAQTISSLDKSQKQGADLKSIRVQMRIIALSDTPEGFAGAVTSANNTQNNINPIDFVAVDPNQERIRKEAEQRDLTYSFRRGDNDPDKLSGFNVRTATIAAACASGQLRLAVASKRYISGLWEDTKREPYISLFNDTTSAIYLWNIVRIMYAVDDTLDKIKSTLSGRERLTCVHANRFILFVIFLDLKKNGVNLNADIEFSGIEKKSKSLAKALLHKLNTLVSERFPEAYPGNIFKNQERQAELFVELKLTML